MLKEEDGKKQLISKLEAARRQLSTAIKLWFAGGDDVSICALSFAAYEIIHKLSTGKRKEPLLFDSMVIKEQYRREWCVWLKNHANFFKHADKDPNGVIEFDPVIAEMLILFSIKGLAELRVKLSDYESAFNYWHCFQNPHLITNSELKRLVERAPVEQLDGVRSLTKCQFLEQFLEARREARLALV